jgi:hypothetical protein
MKNASIRMSPTLKLWRFAAILFFVGYVQADELGEHKFKVDESTFKCILKMTAVRGFFVDNLAGNLEGAVAVAQAGKGAYPEGTVLQLIPNEVMIKQQKGFSPGTNDWEFFALDTDKNGSKIVSRGGQEVNNFLGLSCLSATKRPGRNSTTSASRITAASHCRSRPRCSTPCSTPIRVVSPRKPSAPRTPPR